MDRVEITKPRVVKCQFTNKWVVNTLGRRHECGRAGLSIWDEAFRRWDSALNEANRIGQLRLKTARDRCTARIREQERDYPECAPW